MVMKDGKAWFVPKTYGYGATPVAWQGWALLVLYIGLLVGCAWILLIRGVVNSQPLALVNLGILLAVYAVLTAAFIAIANAKSSDIWRWRWGDKE